jgi:manganese transport protein
VLAAVALFVVLWAMPFGWIERVFGYGGLAMLVFAVAAIDLHPDWSGVAHGFVPSVETGNAWVWAFYVVGLLGAAMTPYEVYFYSSGAVEERWTPRDLGLNRANAIVGYGLGGFLSFALMIGAGALLLPAGIVPETLGTTALVAEVPLGQIGLVLALVGITFAVGGAAIDTAFSGAYNLAQFLGWQWGKFRTNAGAPRFTLTWIVLLGLAFALITTGVDPVLVTEFSVIFSAVALPLTYLPILLVANDRAYMGDHVNGKVANAFGVVYLGVIVLISLAALPVLVLSDMGQG